MRIAIFFVYLFSLLFSRDANAYTGEHDYSFGQHLQQQNTTIHPAPVTEESILIIDYTVPSVEKQDIINDDFEDDDTSNSLAGKSKLPGRCHALSYVAGAPPFCFKLSLQLFQRPSLLFGSGSTQVHFTRRFKNLIATRHQLPEVCARISAGRILLFIHIA